MCRIAAWFKLLHPDWRKKMGNVKSIEKAVESLAPVELTEFRRWFAEFDATALKPQSIYSDPIDSIILTPLIPH